MPDYLKRAEYEFKRSNTPSVYLVLDDILKHLRQQQQQSAQRVDNPVHILEPVHDAESFTVS